MAPVNVPAPLVSVALDRQGIVYQTPDQIRAEAEKKLGRPVTHDASALAMMLASETGERHPETAQIRGHVAINDQADQHRRHPDWNWAASIEGLITYSTFARARGRFGIQEHGRRYASHKPYSEAHLLAAERAIRDHNVGLDPAQGCSKFADKDSFGVQPGSRTYAEVSAEWAREGYHPHHIDGLPEGFVLFSRVA